MDCVFTAQGKVVCTAKDKPVCMGPSPAPAPAPASLVPGLSPSASLFYGPAPSAMPMSLPLYSVTPPSYITTTGDSAPTLAAGPAPGPAAFAPAPAYSPAAF